MIAAVTNHLWQSTLFAAGAVLAFIVVSKGLEFLVNFMPPSTSLLIEAMAYVDFVTGMMLVFGVAFGNLLLGVPFGIIVLWYVVGHVACGR